MMFAGTMVRLGLAALFSGATAGMLLVLAFFASGFLTGAAESWWSFSTLVAWLEAGFLAGLTAASLPAFVAGASMWALSDVYRAARHPLAWAAAGAAVGGLLWATFVLVLGRAGEGGLDADDTALLAAGLVAGAGAALAFRSAIRLGRRPGLMRSEQAR